MGGTFGVRVMMPLLGSGVCKKRMYVYRYKAHIKCIMLISYAVVPVSGRQRAGYQVSLQRESMIETSKKLITVR